MNTENTSGDDSQSQDDTSNEAFSVDNIINELTAEFEPQSSTEESPESEEAKAQPEPSTEVAATPTEETKEALSPLLAEKSRREREARAEIEALKGSTEQAVADAQAAVLAELKTNPQAFIAKYGIENAGDLAMHFYAADLGEDAPDDLKAQIGMSDLDRYKQEQSQELQNLRAEISQREELARNKAVLDQYDGLLSEVPAELPYLAVEVAHDRQEALRTMAQVADHMFQQSGTYPSAVEVAKLIEREISATQARYKAIGETTPDVKQPQTAKVEKEPITTLSTDLSKSKSKKALVGEDEHFNDALDYFEKLLEK